MKAVQISKYVALLLIGSFATFKGYNYYNTHKTSAIGTEKMFKTKDEIQKWLDEMGVKDYTIQDDLTVNVEGDVLLIEKNLNALPVQFGIVKGAFDVSFNQLKSLKGSPKEVEDYFVATHNKLATMEGAPERAGEKFDISYNRLKNLKGSPKEVSGWFIANNNQLKTLEGGPEIVKGKFNVSNNKLKNLKHSAKNIEDGYFANNNQITTLEGGPETVGGDFNVSYNKLKNLKGAPKVGGVFDFSNNPIETEEKKS